MSWSRSVRGTPHEVKKSAAKWKDEQAKFDANVDTDIQIGHATQIDAAVACINAIADSAAPSQLIEGSIWGHANTASPGTFGISLKY